MTGRVAGLPLFLAGFVFLAFGNPLSVWALDATEQEDLQFGLFDECIAQMRANHEAGAMETDTKVPPTLRQIEGFCRCSAKETVSQVSTWQPEHLVNGNNPSPEYLNVLMRSASTCKAEMR